METKSLPTVAGSVKSASEKSPGSTPQSGLANGSGVERPSGQPSRDQMIGRRIGNFVIERKIGSGGMGHVYLAVHSQIGSRVAIKVLSRVPSDHDARTVQRLLDEARLVNLVRSEQIVEIIDTGQLEDGRPYIVMEYLEGQPLSQLMKRTPPIDLRQLLHWMCEVLKGLAAAHGQNIVHRDLKPDNIFITNDGRVKVLDFGVAKMIEGDQSGRMATSTGIVLGTPAYLSPEQASGESIGPESDLYSLGIILYEATMGRRPFVAKTVLELLRMHADAVPDPVSGARAAEFPGLDRMIARSLSKSRAERWPSAVAMLEALSGCLSAAEFRAAQFSHAAFVEPQNLSPNQKPAYAPTFTNTRRFSRTKLVVASAFVLVISAVGIVQLAGKKETSSAPPAQTAGNPAASTSVATSPTSNTSRSLLAPPANATGSASPSGGASVYSMLPMGSDMFVVPSPVNPKQVDALFEAKQLQAAVNAKFGPAKISMFVIEGISDGAALDLTDDAQYTRFINITFVGPNIRQMVDGAPKSCALMASVDRNTAVVTWNGSISCKTAGIDFPRCTPAEVVARARKRGISSPSMQIAFHAKMPTTNKVGWTASDRIDGQSAQIPDDCSP